MGKQQQKKTKKTERQNTHQQKHTNQCKNTMTTTIKSTTTTTIPPKASTSSASVSAVPHTLLRNVLGDEISNFVHGNNNNKNNQEEDDNKNNNKNKNKNNNNKNHDNHYDSFDCSCRILLVGAGGIGCELLKNLALSGFHSITVVDLDTIDVSNLNRQLLFRSHHVGQAKCTIAAQVAQNMILMSSSSSQVQQDQQEQLLAKTTTTKTTAMTHNDGGDKNSKNNDKKNKNNKVDYQAILGYVCDTSIFHVQFIQGFDLVLNALDNLTARRRVNRLCLAAHVPLIEAGTTGYLGQVNVIYQSAKNDNDNDDNDDDDTACYECQSVETPKVYPICTIRSTPSRPVHTIVWAKEFYKLLLSPQPQESMLFEDVTITATLEGEGSSSSSTTTSSSTYMETVQQI